MATSEDFCRTRALDEPIAGTARASVHRWILVEEGGPWRAKTPKNSELPEPVIARLTGLDARAGHRLQMIRRPGEGCGSRRRVFVVDSPEDPAGRRIAEAELELDALAELDPDRFVAEHGRPVTRLDGLWLVCTHGTRDRCCAKWGMPIWDRVRELAPHRVWQASHLGGHRFAATFVVLPVGLMWGRFEPDAIPELAAALERGELGALDQLRGRTSYGQPAQVAEVELRRRHGWLADAALTLTGVEASGAGRHRVGFETPIGLRTIEVEVQPIAANLSNCTDAEPSPRKTLRVLG